MTDAAHVNYASQTYQRVEKTTLPILFVLLMTTCFLPQELSFYAGGARLTVARSLLLLSSPFILFRFFNIVYIRGYRFCMADIIVPLTGLQMTLAPALAETVFDKGLMFGGSAALEFYLPYMAIRVFILDRRALFEARTLIVTCISIVALLAPLDVLTRSWFIHDIAARIGGTIGVRGTFEELRFGLFRATSTVEHPILLGTICMAGIFLAATMRGSRRIFFMTACTIGLFSSLSSAPLGATLLGIVILTYDRVFRAIATRWLFLIVVLLLAVIVVYVGSKNPTAFLLNKITIDKTSADFRMMIWQMAWPVVMTSPWIGIGIGNDWNVAIGWVNASVDSLFLRAAMTYGIPGAVLIQLSYISCYWINIRRWERDLVEDAELRHLARNLNLLIFLFLYVGLTVYYWGIIWLFSSMLIGLRVQTSNIIAYEADRLTERLPRYA